MGTAAKCRLAGIPEDVEINFGGCCMTAFRHRERSFGGNMKGIVYAVPVCSDYHGD